MGTSFVSINDKGFWMRDSMLTLWLRLLALHLEEPTKDGIIERNIRDKWLLASRGFFPGCIPDDLEDAVSTDEGRQVVIGAIKSLISTLAKGPKTLDPGTLNTLGISGAFFSADVEAWRLIEVGNAFLTLIAGEIQSDASSTEFMPGCGTRVAE